MNQESEAVPPKRKRGRPSRKIEMVCEVCPARFLTIPAEIARGAGRYCSAECRGRAATLKIAARQAPAAPRATPRVEMVCEGCLSRFRVNPHRGPDSSRPARFCSYDCRLLAPNERAGKGVR